MKYKNIKTIKDGITFASKKEAKRYEELKILSKAQKIRDLELQPKYPLIVNGHKVCTYIGDFTYKENGKSIIEDVKGVKTSVYRLKKKLMKAILGIDIFEV